MQFVITSDPHGDFRHFRHLEPLVSTSVVILGDAGLNFHLNKNDYWRKYHLINKFPFTFYCVRGNHEARLQDVPGMKLVYDKNVKGEVWVEDKFPQIKYFKDWGIYEIQGYKTLVIGGAYSIDKQIRLKNDWPWFANEQLSEKEKNQCSAQTEGKEFDLVLSHTCPISWQPQDMFINATGAVDKSMEEWLEKIKYSIKWNVWLFGHYHLNRIERPHVEIYYDDMELLTDIMNRWKKFDETQELDWWTPKSPNFYMKDIW